MLGETEAFFIAFLGQTVHQIQIIGTDHEVFLLRIPICLFFGCEEDLCIIDLDLLHLPLIHHGNKGIVGNLFLVGRPELIELLPEDQRKDRGNDQQDQGAGKTRPSRLIPIGIVIIVLIIFFHFLFLLVNRVLLCDALHKRFCGSTVPIDDRSLKGIGDHIHILFNRTTGGYGRSTYADSAGNEG